MCVIYDCLYKKFVGQTIISAPNKIVLGPSWEKLKSDSWYQDLFFYLYSITTLWVFLKTNRFRIATQKAITIIKTYSPVQYTRVWNYTYMEVVQNLLAQNKTTKERYENVSSCSKRGYDFFYIYIYKYIQEYRESC